MSVKRLAAIWLGVGWPLNLTWEVSQAAWFAVPGDSSRHLLFCVEASVVDVLILAGLFLFMAAAAESWLWWQGGAARLAALAGAGFAAAALIEVRALAAGAWIYSDGMPLVPGLGVGWSPILQMMLIPVLLAILSRRFARAVAAKGVPT
jgi:hypothetical protein